MKLPEDADSIQLFNVINDPNERNNLVRNDILPKVLLNT